MNNQLKHIYICVYIYICNTCEEYCEQTASAIQFSDSIARPTYRSAQSSDVELSRAAEEPIPITLAGNSTLSQREAFIDPEASLFNGEPATFYEVGDEVAIA